MRALLAALVALAATSLSAPAFADIAPPPGYVEKCTIDNHQKDGKTCTSCRADFRSRDRCESELGPKGYTRACRTRGASVWSEVWCLDSQLAPPPRPTPAQPAPTPAEPPPSPNPAPEQSAPAPEVKAADVAPKRDGKCGAGGLATGLPLALALGSLALTARVRRRS